MQKQIIEIEDVGEVLLERSLRSKRLNLTVRARGSVRVAVPRGVSFARAAHFARSRTQWIRNSLSELIDLAQKAEALCRTPLDQRLARRRLLQRLGELAAAHGFFYNRVAVRNQQTRWGSCSLRNNINLNINLVRLPTELMDYVLLHELVHTRIKNHGPQFWRELDHCIDDARTLDHALDDYRGLLGRM